MSKVPTLKAEARAASKKGALSELRRAGQIPAILYGGGEEAEAIHFSARDFSRLARAQDMSSTACAISLNGKTIRAIARETQRDPLMGRIRHVDFMRLTKGATLAVEVSVRFTGEEDCQGLRRGGVLNIVRHKVELNCPVDAIPEEIVASLADMDIGDSVHISDIPLPDGVQPTITDRDFTVATLVAPAALRGTEEEEEEGEEEEAAATEETAEGSTEEEQQEKGKDAQKGDASS